MRLVRMMQVSRVLNVGFMLIVSLQLGSGERERHRDGWFSGYLRGLHCIVWAGLELRMVLQPLPHR